MRQELEAARCLVFPSLWYEAYGLVVAEAAARGVPAIVSDVAAPAERMIDGVDGWVFGSGDLDGLVRCMARTRDDALVASAGAAAYRRHWAAEVGTARPRRGAGVDLRYGDRRTGFRLRR